MCELLFGVLFRFNAPIDRHSKARTDELIHYTKWILEQVYTRISVQVCMGVF